MYLSHIEASTFFNYIHISGFCARYGHYLLLPPEFTAGKKTAAVDALDWCPRACRAVMKETQAKRRRLDPVRREEVVYDLFIAGTKFFAN